MKKMILTTLLFTFFAVVLTGCSVNKDENKTDAIKFKEEYEALNDKKNSSDQNYRVLSIPEDNPFIYSTGEEIVKKIENKETFYVYFGSSYCPWCRSVIEKAIEVAKENNIDKIYYVDIWDGAHVEILRDTYKLNEDGEPELVSEGGKGYADLLKYLDNVLTNYNLNDKDGNRVYVGEKRIYAPNFIYIENGEAIKLIEGISEKQKSSIEELTNEILEDEESQFSELFN